MWRSVDYLYFHWEHSQYTDLHILGGVLLCIHVKSASMKAAMGDNEGIPKTNKM